MNISATNNDYYRNYYTPFKSVNRIVNSKDGRIYQTFTQFYRKDLNWDAFIDYIKDKYKNIPKINILNLACSEGAEPCSLAIIIIEKIKENFNKYFPILASDIDKLNIEKAKSGIFDITDRELYRINKKTNNRFDKYFVPEISVTGEITKLKTKPILEDKIKYQSVDILTEIKNAPKSNSVFLIRNVWPYLDIDEKTEILRELAKIDKSCCVVLGEIDNAIDAGYSLELYGFKKIQNLSIYEKEF